MDLLAGSRLGAQSRASNEAFLSPKSCQEREFWQGREHLLEVFMGENPGRADLWNEGGKKKIFFPLLWVLLLSQLWGCSPDSQQFGFSLPSLVPARQGVCKDHFPFPLLPGFPGEGRRIRPAGGISPEEKL